MFVEIGALVQKSIGNEALHKIIDCKGVEYAFMETGRSNDLFEDRQFGDFGEAAIMSIVAEKTAKETFIHGIAGKDLPVINLKKKQGNKISILDLVLASKLLKYFNFFIKNPSAMLV